MHLESGPRDGDSQRQRHAILKGIVSDVYITESGMVKLATNLQSLKAPVPVSLMVIYQRAAILKGTIPDAGY